MQSFRVSEFRRGKASELQRDIAKTLAYSDIFGYSLKEEEIWQWLIVSFNHSLSSSNLSSNLPPKLSFKKSLEELLKKGLVETREGFFFLPGRPQIVGLRKERNRWSEEKMEIVRKTAGKLKYFPWVKMVGITGALAMENCDEDDDIDLMIITSVDRLWLTRLLIFLLCPILGIERRKPKDKKVKNKICFNLFLDEDHLKISPENLFSAHEICQVRPLLNKNQTYEKFLRVNCWVKNYLPNAVVIARYRDSEIAIKQKHLISQYLNIIISFFEKFAYFLQFQYMRPKITIEKVNPHQAFFHPRDLSIEIGEKMKILKLP